MMQQATSKNNLDGTVQGMYIIQIGDLHIGSSEKCGDSEEHILAGAIEKIKQEVPTGQRLLICVCGDIIDSRKLPKRARKKASKRYEGAAKLFSLIQNRLKDYNRIDFRFCAGNHDITHMDEFTNFVHRFDESSSREGLENCYYYEAEGIYYIFINSCHNWNYQFGEINYDKLESLLQTLSQEVPKIFVMHHAAISMYQNDSSAIRDSARLLQIIEKNRVLGVLHGHIHGNEQFPLGDQSCQMIGTGALFSRNYPNVCSQFNLIYVDPFAFRNISSCVYLADGRIRGDNWHRILLQEDRNENYFQGSEFSTVHQKLLGKLQYKHDRVLNNVVLQINCPYVDFIKDLKEYLKDDVLPMGQNQFSYFELAEKWERVTPPPELYFNHGQYFQSHGQDEMGKHKHAIYSIIHQIKDAPTSNRAVLTTFNTDDALRPRGGSDYLPSLLSIQFSLDSMQSTLYVHMNLRALEAGSFLKINICEIYWLLEQMKEENIPFNNVDIAISAFRVQVRDRFKCFLKAEIDSLSPAALCDCVYKKDILRICRMLEEKRDSSETITNVQGIHTLYEAMRMAGYKNENTKKLENICSTYEQIGALQQRGSVRTLKEKEYEDCIRQDLSEIIDMLKQEDEAMKA